MTGIKITASAEETQALAADLAKEARPGTVVCLDGELGVGKTVFSKGFCRALGVTDEISSPTFTIVNEYQGSSLPVYHFDLYRIGSPEELYEIGFDDYMNDEAVSLIEWSVNVPDALPQNRIEVLIERDGVDENTRRITVTQRN